MQDIIVLDLTRIKRFSSVCCRVSAVSWLSWDINIITVKRPRNASWNGRFIYLAPQVSIPAFPAFVYWSPQGVRISPHLPPRYLPKPFIHLSLQNVRLVTSPEETRGLTAPWKTQYCLQQHVEQPALVYLDSILVSYYFSETDIRNNTVCTTCSLQGRSVGGPECFLLSQVAQPSTAQTLPDQTLKFKF